MEEIKWYNIEDLPIDKEQNKKVLLLTEGRLSGSTTLHIVTDYWNVFFDNRDFDLNIFNKKKKLSDNCYSYGKFGEGKIPMNKIKGWMYADDLIGLYDGKGKV
jgi:hypothetical protein